MEADLAAVSRPVPDVKNQVLATGSEVAGDTPEEFAAFVRSESAKWSKVIRDANIKPD